MGRISRFFFPPTHTRFKFIGSPAKFRGPAHEVSASYVFTSGVGNEPIKIHCVPAYVSALYIVEYVSRNKLLLLDCGSPCDVERVKFYVEQVMNLNRETKLTMSDVKLAVATHCHFDHCGASKGYEQMNIPIAAASNMETSYTSFRGRLLQFVHCSTISFIANRLGRIREDPFIFSEGPFGPYWPCSPKTPMLLEDGQPLPNGFNDWVAIKVPGHTTHMIGLYHTPSRIFYCSDTTVKLKKGFFAPRPVNYSWAYIHTLNRIRPLHVRCLLLPHGGIVEVRKEYGSWVTIVDNIMDHYKKEINRFMPTKGQSTRLRVYWGHFLNKVIHGFREEDRKFEKSDLPTGPLPTPWEKPQPFTVQR